MKTIQKTTSNEIVINKSIFITHLFRVNNLEDVNNTLQSIRKKYYDATHNCYAYILGSRAEIQKASDDGEPQKTAGMPMLDVLKKRELTNILAITTRYFGGILLGAGGLIRAYSSSVSEALNNAEIYEYLDYLTLEITVSYSIYNTINSTLNEYTIFNIDYQDNVKIKLGVLPSEASSLKERLIDLASGQIELHELGISQMEILIKHNES